MLAFTAHTKHSTNSTRYAVRFQCVRVCHNRIVRWACVWVGVCLYACIVLILTHSPIHGLLCVPAENKALRRCGWLCRSLSYISSCIFPFYWLLCVSQPNCLSLSPHRRANNTIQTLCSLSSIYALSLGCDPSSRSLFSAIFIQVIYGTVCMHLYSCGLCSHDRSR